MPVFKFDTTTVPNNQIINDSIERAHKIAFFGIPSFLNFVLSVASTIVTILSTIDAADSSDGNDDASSDTYDIAQICLLYASLAVNLLVLIVQISGLLLSRNDLNPDFLNPRRIEFYKSIFWTGLWPAIGIGTGLALGSVGLFANHDNLAVKAVLTGFAPLLSSYIVNCASEHLDEESNYLIENGAHSHCRFGI